MAVAQLPLPMIPKRIYARILRKYTSFAPGHFFGSNNCSFGTTFTLVPVLSVLLTVP